MTYRPKSYILRGKSYNTELVLQWGIDRSLIHVFFILKNRFFKEDESFLVFLPYEPRMFLKCFLINQVQITILMIPMFLCSCNEKKKKKKKKGHADPCVFKAFQSYRQCRWSHLQHFWYFQRWKLVIDALYT